MSGPCGDCGGYDHTWLCIERLRLEAQLLVLRTAIEDFLDAVDYVNNPSSSVVAPRQLDKLGRALETNN
jgi:hypothetical protein